jgi:hypothetical protein
LRDAILDKWNSLDKDDLNRVMTDMDHTDLIEANLERAKYDNATKWPDGFDPTQAGPINEDKLQ